jgi:nucleoside 2-deoxyribosyltransferase
LHELGFLIYEYLVAEKNFVSQIEGSNLKITPRGWSQIDSLRQGNPQSKIGFIAMWFDKSIDPAHAAIEAGIRSSGYEPLRIDRKEHNNKIDDEIVAGIRRSKFLVADFTGHRGGVYFETGFATGLGLQVIWLCRQDELEKTHFDTRQYNFIVWEAGKLDDLSKALQIRIEATIGRGPLAEKA